MAPPIHHQNRNKKYLSKNESVRIYREKKKRTDLHKQQVEELLKQYEEFDASTISTFEDIPLTDRTQNALKKWKYKTPTEIQKDSIPLALKGHDILGAAQTGSGKTLAFVIPVLEYLFREGWWIVDGLGAMIITPTRELAYQIFEVFNKVGQYHNFSIALVIGGKDLAKEKTPQIKKCNIVICTPGRILQHMDENPSFDTTNLKLLVLDEADRILDLGFEKTINAILENLPPDRQTLLFSATQTKSVKNLARLSLKNPVYVSVHEHATHSTPESLEQSYLVCEAQTKMNLIWSFIKSHRMQKILIFMSSCKQVKYTYEIFCRMKPGMSVLALYGSLHQLKRMQIYDEFVRKLHVVMFATDIASRGLDFPGVNWVVQLDCPEDVNTYIHRVGRTARYQKGGEALLVLLPSEKESMVKQLKDKKIPINEIKVNPAKLFSVQRKMEALCAYDVNLKDSAQRAFKAYCKSIFLMKDKTIFDVTKLDTESYAKSLGMAFAPRIRFVEKRLKIKSKNPSSFDSYESSLKNESLTGNKSAENETSLSRFRIDEESDDDDEFLKPKGTVKLVDTDVDEEEIKQDMENKKSKKALTKVAIAKKILKKKIKLNTVIKYDVDEKPIQDVPTNQLVPDAIKVEKEILEEGYNIEKAKLLMVKEDEIDKQIHKQKMKEKHKIERRKQKEDRSENNTNSAPQLGESEDEDDESDSIVDPNNMSDSESDFGSKEMPVSPSFQDENSTEHDSEDDVPLKGKKRRKRMKDKQNKIQNVIREEINQQSHFETGLSVEDDESLALHFLTNS